MSFMGNRLEMGNLYKVGLSRKLSWAIAPITMVFMVFMVPVTTASGIHTPTYNWGGLPARRRMLEHRLAGCLEMWLAMAGKAGQWNS